VSFRHPLCPLPYLPFSLHVASAGFSDRESLSDHVAHILEGAVVTCLVDTSDADGEGHQECAYGLLSMVFGGDQALCLGGPSIVMALGLLGCEV
jgi:hypothetical protein